jgi:hypothetical protein
MDDMTRRMIIAAAAGAVLAVVIAQVTIWALT